MENSVEGTAEIRSHLMEQIKNVQSVEDSVKETIQSMKARIFDFDYIVNDATDVLVYAEIEKAGFSENDKQWLYESISYRSYFQYYFFTFRKSGGRYISPMGGVYLNDPILPISATFFLSLYRADWKFIEVELGTIQLDGVITLENAISNEVAFSISDFIDQGKNEQIIDFWDHHYYKFKGNPNDWINFVSELINQFTGLTMAQKGRLRSQFNEWRTAKELELRTPFNERRADKELELRTPFRYKIEFFWTIYVASQLEEEDFKDVPKFKIADNDKSTNDQKGYAEKAAEWGMGIFGYECKLQTFTDYQKRQPLAKKGDGGRAPFEKYSKSVEEVLIKKFPQHMEVIKRKIQELIQTK